MAQKVPTELSQKYRLPRTMSDFQMMLYPHLIEWKWRHITRDPGSYDGRIYDAILPRNQADEYSHIYAPARAEILKNHGFKKHPHFGHMASSQAACINLFAPLLLDAKLADRVFPIIKPDFSHLATDRLDNGFRFEYWDEANTMNDHTRAAGTDADVAIAYYDTHGDLCLWLIEHKLAETEFTTCGGYRSKGNRDTKLCKDGPAVLADTSNCYYQYRKKYRYWQMLDMRDLYDEQVLQTLPECPFKDGKNQLWRNQIMGEAIRRQGLYRNVYLSVTHHPDNPDLTDTIESYKALLKNQNVLSVLTSADVLDAAQSIHDPELDKWVEWYQGLYCVRTTR